MKSWKKIATKFPRVFPRVIAVRTERKSLNIAVTKRQRKQGGGGNIQAILAIRVWKNIHGTQRDIQRALSLTLILCVVFPVNHKDTLIHCHSFINPYNLIRKQAEFRQGFQLATSENNFVQNTNLYNTLPFGGRKAGSESTSTITSTTKSSVSSLNPGESWSNLDTLVTAAVSCDDQTLE